jgi:hypothetical protein
MTSLPRIQLDPGFHRELKAVWFCFKYSVELIKAVTQIPGIKKNAYPHILLHSFAAHFLKQGNGLQHILDWPGCESSKTTEIYTHVSKIDFKIHQTKYLKVHIHSYLENCIGN